MCGHLISLCSAYEPTLNEIFVLLHFTHDNTIQICNRIMFDFHPGLPHMSSLFLTTIKFCILAQVFGCGWSGHVATLRWVGRRGGGGKERKVGRGRGGIGGWRVTWLDVPVNHIQHEWPVASVHTTSESFAIRISVLFSVTCDCNYQKSSITIRSFLLRWFFNTRLFLDITVSVQCIEVRWPVRCLMYLQMFHSAICIIDLTGIIIHR